MRPACKAPQFGQKKAVTFRDWPCKRHIGCLHISRASMRPKEHKFQRYAEQAYPGLTDRLSSSQMTLRRFGVREEAATNSMKRFLPARLASAQDSY